MPQIKETLQDKVYRITLCRPPLNVMDIAMLEELGQACRRAVDSDASIILLTGEGKAFSSGVDVGDHDEAKVKQASQLFSKVFEILRETDKPIFAAVNGYALGGGCELAMAADIIVASEKAKFGQPEIGVGAVASIACYCLFKRVSRSHAFELLLSGKHITAQRAYEMGLVNEVLPLEGFAEAVDGYIAQYTALSPLLLAKTKKAALAAEGKGWDEGIAIIEDIYEREVTPSHDAKEGIAAFLEKRKPVWTGE